jgi:elongation factor 2
MAGEKMAEKVKRIVANPENIRNICTSAHIHHGKTAFTDNLLAAAGMMAAKYAGDLDSGMTTWQHSDEQERLLTVDAANVSMVHEFGGKEFLINLIDTPGHIDFGGNVTRAMRAVDGTIVLVCASEGIMPQTETVIKQALRERVKPVLFIKRNGKSMHRTAASHSALQGTTGLFHCLS